MKTGNNRFIRLCCRALLLCAAAGATSCLNEYLDKAPDAGLNEKEVFSKYANFKSYFYSVYSGANFNIKAHYPLWFAGSNQKFTMEGLTDLCDMTRIQRCQPGKQGDGSQVTWAVGYNTDNPSYTGKVPYSWKVIRVCNMAIDKIDMLQDVNDPRDKQDLLAQAYFVRAYAHFELFRLYGSLPYIDKVLGADDEWDLPRLADVEMCQRAAADFKTAAEIFDQARLMRRDPASGAGHLAAPDQDKPNGVTALAMRGRALLYAASPLSNPTNDVTLWEAAAEANWEAYEAAELAGYKLLPQAEYTKNFYGTKYTNEQLWGYSTGSPTNYNNDRVQAYVPYCFSNNAYSSGQCPTQNFVDRFETLGGYSLLSEEDRALAVAAGEYNEQNPYANRDPRFDVVIIYNQKPLRGYGNASLYVNEDGSLPSGSLLKRKDGSSDGVSETYYYERKRTGNLSNEGEQNVILTDPIIRLAEVYLNYAEAANEAYGPNGMAPGATLSALGSLNEVRARVGMPGVRAEYVTDAASLRSRIRNERTVELCFEGYHYYCDIRRWKDAPRLGRTRLMGMRVTKLAAGANAQYPTGYKYERFELPSARQIGWKNDGMYYVQFQPGDLLKMKNYVPNESW